MDGKNPELRTSSTKVAKIQWKVPRVRSRISSPVSRPRLQRIGMGSQHQEQEETVSTMPPRSNSQASAIPSSCFDSLNNTKRPNKSLHCASLTGKNKLASGRSTMRQDISS
jgi:hypothetical protein